MVSADEPPTVPSAQSLQHKQLAVKDVLPLTESAEGSS